MDKSTIDDILDNAGVESKAARGSLSRMAGKYGERTFHNATDFYSKLMEYDSVGEQMALGTIVEIRSKLWTEGGRAAVIRAFRTLEAAYVDLVHNKGLAAESAINSLKSNPYQKAGEYRRL